LQYLIILENLVGLRPYCRKLYLSKRIKKKSFFLNCIISLTLRKVNLINFIVFFYSFLINFFGILVLLKPKSKFGLIDLCVKSRDG
jgi:hypothetical protein